MEIAQKKYKDLPHLFTYVISNSAIYINTIVPYQNIAMTISKHQVKGGDWEITCRATYQRWSTKNKGPQSTKTNYEKKIILEVSLA